MVRSRGIDNGEIASSLVLKLENERRLIAIGYF